MKRFAWFLVGYLVAVILFGAWVRVSGAGAGCGNHWPSCQGVVVPVEPGTKTIIEFTHRVTSALSGLLGLGLLIWCWRSKSPALRWALGTFVFLLVEGFIGAVLVKQELVAGNASLSRAIVISLHLVNTMLLMLCAVMVALRAETKVIATGKGARLIWAVMGLMVVANMTGAVTALGDTLFPIQPTLGTDLFAKIREDAGADQHFLVRLRIIHPIFAALTGTFILVAFNYIRSTWSKFGMLVVLGQMGLGILTIALAAPGWMQIAHLFLAQVLWIAVVAVWAESGA